MNCPTPISALAIIIEKFTKPPKPSLALSRQPQSEAEKQEEIATSTSVCSIDSKVDSTQQ